MKISGGGNALVFPDGSVMSSAATGVGGGTITGVNAGAGLSGGGTAGGVTLGIANGGVTNALLGANSVANTNIADGSISPTKISGTGATLGANNFTGSQNIAGNLNLTANGSVTAFGGTFVGLGGGIFGRDTLTSGALAEVSFTCIGN